MIGGLRDLDSSDDNKNSGTVAFAVAFFFPALREYLDWRQPYTCIFEALHHHLREIDSHATCVCSPWKMCNVQYEEDVLDLIHSA
jgi:hypothetical protein